MAVTAIMPLVSVGGKRPMIDIASTSGGIDEEHVGDAHQHIFGPAAEIAGDEPDRHADRRRDRQDEHRSPRSDSAVAEDDAGEQVAPDEIGAEYVVANAAAG